MPDQLTASRRRRAARKPEPGGGPSGGRSPASGTISGQNGAAGLRLVGYLRVSTDEQADHGYGLAAQRAAIKATARSMGARIVKWISDPGVSGTLPADQRPGLTDALAYVHDGRADGLIVRDLDRLARAIFVQEAVLATVWARGRVFTATGEVLRDDPDDPYRTAMRQMAGVFAELEHRMIVKRLRDGRAAKKRAGGHSVGRPPYGWTTSPRGPLVPVPAEQKALRLMRSMANGGASTREIAKALDAEGFPTKRGGEWRSNTVAQILARPTPTKTRKAAS